MAGFIRSWRKPIDPAELAEEALAIENLQFENNEDKALFHEARLGLEVCEFCNSDAGKYLRRRCQAIVGSHTTALVEVDPFDSEKIAALQIDFKAARLMISMITDAIQNGENAAREIEERE